MGIDLVVGKENSMLRRGGSVYGVWCDILINVEPLMNKYLEAIAYAVSVLVFTVIAIIYCIVDCMLSIIVVILSIFFLMMIFGGR